MFSIFEQTAVLLGEAKHGVWRIQDNGHIREYRKHSRVGLSDSIDPNDPSLSQQNLDVIQYDYTHYMPEDKSLYRLPTDKVDNGFLQYVDLTIYHPKYGGKYNNHEPIDLAHFFCTMSQAGYPHMWQAWQYAIKQPMMNKIGPLGKRAGWLYVSLSLWDLLLPRLPKTWYLHASLSQIWLHAWGSGQNHLLNSFSFSSIDRIGH